MCSVCTPAADVARIAMAEVELNPQFGAELKVRISRSTMIDVAVVLTDATA